MEDSAIISDSLIGHQESQLIEALQRPEARIPHHDSAIRENAHRVTAMFDRRLGIDNCMNALDRRCVHIRLNHPGEQRALKAYPVGPGCGKNIVGCRCIRRNKVPQRIESTREEVIALPKVVVGKACHDTAIRKGTHISKRWLRRNVTQLAKAIVEQRQMPLTVEQYDIAIWQCRKAKSIRDRICPGVTNIGDGRNQVPSTGEDRKASWC